MSIRNEEQQQHRNMRERSVYIINAGDETWTVTRPYRPSPYVIEGRGDDRYSVTEIKGARDRMDMGDARSVTIDIMADEIATDLIRESNLGPFGLFVSYTSKPSEKELTEAESRRDKHYVRLVEEADTDWMRYHNITMIQDVAKRAARRLGMEREWLYDVPLQQDCPACGEKIKPGVAICKSCHAIVDPKKYAEMKFVGATA